jgi:hypothetical protein
VSLNFVETKRGVSAASRNSNQMLQIGFSLLAAKIDEKLSLKNCFVVFAILTNFFSSQR